ncbi:hypothetical protein BGZ76_004679, partial [Entomortierella beljakovae]
MSAVEDSVVGPSVSSVNEGIPEHYSPPAFSEQQTKFSELHLEGTTFKWTMRHPQAPDDIDEWLFFKAL